MVDQRQAVLPPSAKRQHRRASTQGVVALAAAVAFTFWVATAATDLLWVCGRATRTANASATREARPMISMRAGADSFDPWTVLEISPNAGKDEARKAYKKMIAKYHPDVNPSEEAAAKFDQIVRAHAVITGEDRDLDQASLLKNAVENLRNDMEFKKARIEQLKAEAEAEEKEIAKMSAQVKEAEAKREEVTTELGVFGGAAIGLAVGGPTGALLGGVAGLFLKDSDNGVGQVIRGVGSVAKGVVGAVGKAVEKVDSKSAPSKEKQ